VLTIHGVSLLCTVTEQVPLDFIARENCPANHEVEIERHEYAGGFPIPPFPRRARPVEDVLRDSLPSSPGTGGAPGGFVAREPERPGDRRSEDGYCQSPDGAEELGRGRAGVELRVGQGSGVGREREVRSSSDGRGDLALVRVFCHGEEVEEVRRGAASRKGREV
jgi:hypothetical protein